MPESHHEDDWLEETEEEHQRRGFLKIVAGTLGGLLFLAPFAAGALPIFGPLFRRRDSDGEPGFDVRVAALADVPADGVPRTFAVYGEERNVWNYQPQVKVGEVILERDVTDGTLRAFSTVCPHLGCAVRTAEDEELKAARDEELAKREATKKAAEEAGQPAPEEEPLPPPYEFRCPCHNSVFLLNGEKAVPEPGDAANPSPRGLDTLPPPAQTPNGLPNTANAYVFADADGNEQVYVRYQEYFTGRAEKIAKES